MTPRPLLVLLDYDGTLTPITGHPARARLSRSTKRTLEALARRPGVRVALISGRALADVKRMAGVRGAWYAGNHGLQIEAGRRRWVHPAARRASPQVARAVSSLREALRGVPGAWVEDKRLTASVHWRRVPPSALARFRRAVKDALAPHLQHRTLRVTRGKRVIELRPMVRWGKGDAVRWLRRRVAPPPRVIYLGDDQTDEEAFAAVNRFRGLSIFVGRRPRGSAARWSVRSVSRAGRLLDRLRET